MRTFLCLSMLSIHITSLVTLALITRLSFAQASGLNPQDPDHMTSWTICRNVVREWKPEPNEYVTLEEELGPIFELKNRPGKRKLDDIIKFFKQYDQITGAYWPKIWKTIVR